MSTELTVHFRVVIIYFTRTRSYLEVDLTVAPDRDKLISGSIVLVDETDFFKNLYVLKNCIVHLLLPNKL